MPVLSKPTHIFDFPAEISTEIWVLLKTAPASLDRVIRVCKLWRDAKDIPRLWGLLHVTETTDVLLLTTWLMRAQNTDLEIYIDFRRAADMVWQNPDSVEEDDPLGYHAVCSKLIAVMEVLLPASSRWRSFQIFAPSYIGPLLKTDLISTLSAARLMRLSILLEDLSPNHQISTVPTADSIFYRTPTVPHHCVPVQSTLSLGWMTTHSCGVVMTCQVRLLVATLRSVSADQCRSGLNFAMSFGTKSVYPGPAGRVIFSHLLVCYWMNHTQQPLKETACPQAYEARMNSETETGFNIMVTKAFRLSSKDARTYPQAEVRRPRNAVHVELACYPLVWDRFPFQSLTSVTLGPTSANNTVNTLFWNVFAEAISSSSTLLSLALSGGIPSFHNADHLLQVHLPTVQTLSLALLTEEELQHLTRYLFLPGLTSLALRLTDEQQNFLPFLQQIHLSFPDVSTLAFDEIWLPPVALPSIDGFFEPFHALGHLYLDFRRGGGVDKVFWKAILNSAHRSDFLPRLKSLFLVDTPPSYVQELVLLRQRAGSPITTISLHQNHKLNIQCTPGWIRWLVDNTTNLTLTDGTRESWVAGSGAMHFA
ncbi:hypothetical protein C8R43DRAFT_957351 [Mycena crocata]|nr:hypothetical protein C8R43DRAFT_957351 [Mycena crocata]